MIIYSICDYAKICLFNFQKSKINLISIYIRIGNNNNQKCLINAFIY